MRDFRLADYASVDALEHPRSCLDLQVGRKRQPPSNAARPGWSLKDFVVTRRVSFLNKPEMVRERSWDS